MSRIALSLAVVALVTACGDDPEPAVPDAGTPDAGSPDGGNVPDAGQDDGDDCTPITLGAQSFQLNLFGQLTGVRFAVSPGFGEELPESLLVELYDSTTNGLPPLEPGTFALGTAPNDNLATCQHCVWIPVDWDGVSPMTTVLLATEGSITLSQVEDPLSWIFIGSTTDLVLREATIDETGHTTLVDGGRCARVSAITIDTSPTPGRDCLSAEDCGNMLLEVCSPASGTCTPHECGDVHGCPEDRPVCLTQVDRLSEGACYFPCDPTAPIKCGVDQVCVQHGVDPHFGICMRSGSGHLGEPCAHEDTSTECDPGHICSNTTGLCTRLCPAFASAPGCQPEHSCSILGVCEPSTTGMNVTFGEPCGDTATLAQGCAEEGGSFRGICFAHDPTQPLICLEACFDRLGCEPEEFCALRFTSGLGVCLPVPVCGDGELGEINEVCDDGNQVDGDGCRGDCGAVEYEEICPDAPLLSTGEYEGNTTTGWDGFLASCQLGIARTEVFRFEPTARGRLRLTLDAPTAHTVSLRSECDDDGSELACETTDFEGTRELIHQVVSEESLLVLVSAWNMLEQGPFTLHTEFRPEECGDGVVAGLEVCDDGNTASNDGCRGDCAELEYGFYCEQSVELTTSESGNNDGGPYVFRGSCANSVRGSGPDRLFHYTAASDGTLRLRLDPEPAGVVDLVLAVFDGCGEPSTMNELACSSVYDVERAELQVTAGQTLTILVEGFHRESVSPFTLTAELVP